MPAIVVWTFAFGGFVATGYVIYRVVRWVGESIDEAARAIGLQG